MVFVLQLPFSNFPLFLKTLGAEYLSIVYLAAMALTRSMRWFGATFGSIMLDFPFFCFEGIEARKISLYNFAVFGGGKVQNHACGTAFHRVNGRMAVDVRTL